jgi:hypothetical protein
VVADSPTLKAWATKAAGHPKAKAPLSERVGFLQPHGGRAAGGAVGTTTYELMSLVG